MGAACGDEFSSRVNYSLREIYLDIDMYLDEDDLLSSFPSAITASPSPLCGDLRTAPTPRLAPLAGGRIENASGDITGHPRCLSTLCHEKDETHHHHHHHHRDYYCAWVVNS